MSLNDLPHYNTDLKAIEALERKTEQKCKRQSKIQAFHEICQQFQTDIQAYLIQAIVADQDQLKLGRTVRLAFPEQSYTRTVNGYQMSYSSKEILAGQNHYVADRFGSTHHLVWHDMSFWSKYQMGQHPLTPIQELLFDQFGYYVICHDEYFTLRGRRNYLGNWIDWSKVWLNSHRFFFEEPYTISFGRWFYT